MGVDGTVTVTSSYGGTTVSVLTAARISALAVELLGRQLVLVATVSRVPGRDFSGPSGGAVTLRVPVPRTARVQETPGSPIVFDAISETPVTCTVNHVYDGVRVTDEDMSLSVENFARQFLVPQTEAVARRGEQFLSDVMNDLDADLYFPADTVDLADWDEKGYEDRILEAGELLDQNDVPAGDRYMAVSPYVARRVLRVDKFTRVDASGERTALRQAMLGDLYGFRFVKSNNLAPGRAVAYHTSAFAFGTLSPVAPAGVVESATAEDGGVAMRAIRQYNPSILSEESVISTFVGATEVDDARRVVIDSEGIGS